MITRHICECQNCEFSILCLCQNCEFSLLCLCQDCEFSLFCQFFVTQLQIFFFSFSGIGGFACEYTHTLSSLEIDQDLSFIEKTIRKIFEDLIQYSSSVSGTKWIFRNRQSCKILSEQQNEYLK